MYQSWKINFRLTLSILILLALTSCTTTGSRPATDSRGVLSAETAFSRGDYERAAKNWQQDALEASPRQAATMRVKAADAWLLADNVENAEDVLRWVTRSELDSASRAMMDLVLADLALRNDRPGEAEQLLQKARPALPRSSNERYENLQADVRQQLSSPGYRDISQAAAISDSMDFYDPVASVELIRSLENVSSGELAIRSENPRGERNLIGWLDLALVIRQNLVIPDQVTTSMTAWKTRHPYHQLTEQQALDT